MKPYQHKPRTTQKLWSLCLAAGLLTGVASAQTSFQNLDFELPATGKISTGFDTAGANDVPGWKDAGPNQADEGIEGSGSGYTGSYSAYLHKGQSGAYQIGTNVLQFGDIVTLTWYEKNAWLGLTAKVSLLGATSQGDAFGSTTTLAAQTNVLGNPDFNWYSRSITFTAGSGDVGKLVGVAFQSADPATADGWADFDDFAITVTPGPTTPGIVTQPVGPSVNEGDPATITVVATGPDLSYQWKASAPGAGVFTNVPGATGATLTIAYASASADYLVSITNVAGSTNSDVATLTVTPATYVNGLFNGDFELPGTGKISSGFDVPGANNVPGWRNAGPNQDDTGIESSGSGNNSLFAAYLHRGQSGAYQIGTNVLHLGDSVTLTWDARDSWQGVLAKVSILSASSQDAAFGSTTILTAQTNEVTGWWAQNSLTVTVGAADVGKLVGVAFQSADPATATGWANFDNFAITVTPAAAAPSIVTQPANQTGYLAGSATFTVLASGSGLNYQWQSGVVGSGIYTNISNGGQFSGATAASLTISNLTVDNGLDYVVIVSNTGGSVTSTPPATLTVNTSVPVINTQPASITRFTTETATFTVATTGAVSYQWKAGAVGSGIYTNLSNGGQFSGVNTATLNVANLQVANQADYVVEVSNGAGPVTSDPATLTIVNLIYSQDFETSSNVITAVGWVADSTAGQAVLGAPYWGGKCIFDAEGTNLPLAYYTSTLLNHGNIPGETGFPVIKLASVSNLTFYTDVQSWWNPASEHTYFIVQMNGGDWYSSATELTSATGGQETRTMLFDTNSTAWNQLTVSGNGSATSATIGAAATNNLTGYITGAGLVTVHDSSSWINLDNFKISGDGFTVLPGLSIAKSGANVVLTWGYGTLVESTSVTGPWTPAGGTSPKTVSPTDGSHFYGLQLP